jgi:hypothetical protein
MAHRDRSPTVTSPRFTSLCRECGRGGFVQPGGKFLNGPPEAASPWPSRGVRVPLNTCRDMMPARGGGGNEITQVAFLAEFSPGFRAVEQFRRRTLWRKDPMNPPDEFLKHAVQCEQMAKFTRDTESKATWKRMAERWRRCAERFTSQSSAAHHHAPRQHRKPVPGWSENIRRRAG